MSTLGILIAGAGVCGPTLAMLLQRSNPHHKITIVERWPTLRAEGQQIDLKSEGLRILEKMGLLDAIESRCVKETGLEFVDSRGRSAGRFGVRAAGGDRNRRTLTNEYEIMRGDMVEVLYAASLKLNAELKGQMGPGEGLTYEFDKTVTELTQTDDGVSVSFSDGQKKRFDLVIAADGLRSRTRRLAFGRDTSDAAFRSIGVHAAYYDVPRIEGLGDGGLATGYSAPGRRMIMTRTSGRSRTQVLLFTMQDDAGKLQKCYREPVEKQKQAFTEAFKDAGWQTGRLLDGMAATEDFYAFEIGQIKMENLFKGRVVLLGDAGYCPSPFTGMGTECCLIGAYVLAGELARRGRDVHGALKSYEEMMRAPIQDLQQLPGRFLPLFFPSSRIGITVLRYLTWAASKIDQVRYQPPTETPKTKLDKKMGYNLPDYSELNLAPEVEVMRNESTHSSRENLGT